MLHFIWHLGMGIAGSVVFLLLDLLSKTKTFDKNRDGRLDWSEIKEYLYFNVLQFVGIGVIAVILAIPWPAFGGEGILTPIGEALNMGEHKDLIYFSPGVLWTIVQWRYRKKFIDQK